MIDSGTNTALERMIKAIWASYRPFLAGLAAVQEQNRKLVQYSTGMFLREAERQREAMQAMVEGSFRSYTSLLYAPVSSPSNGGARAEDGDPNLPVEDYDRLSMGDLRRIVRALSRRGRGAQRVRDREPEPPRRDGAVRPKSGLIQRTGT